MTARGVRSGCGIAKDKVLRRFRLRRNERVNGLARACVFDAAVEVGIMDRGREGSFVHDDRSGKAG
jgi:hypothetical protein